MKKSRNIFKVFNLIRISTIIILSWIWVSTANASNYVYIKYRADPVDVSGFKYLNTQSSSLVRGAWYDQDNNYMIIRLNHRAATL